MTKMDHPYDRNLQVDKTTRHVDFKEVTQTKKKKKKSEKATGSCG